MGANVAPLVLLPLAAVLVWAAIWKVWLPETVPGSTTTRTVTTVDRQPATRPVHAVTTVVASKPGATPSRRSETLAIALLLLGTGAALVAVFNRRVASVELGRDGFKVTLNATERRGLVTLVGLLQQHDGDAERVARGVERYFGELSERWPGQLVGTSRTARADLTDDDAAELARTIASELT